MEYLIKLHHDNNKCAGANWLENKPNRFLAKTSFVLAWASLTEDRGLGVLNSKHLFLTVLEAGTLRSGCQYGWILGESLFPGLQTAIFSLYSHMVERRSKLSHISSCEGTIPSIRTPPSWPNYLPKAPPPNTITLGVRISTYKFGGGTQTFSP